jgi:hypothetical protein
MEVGGEINCSFWSLGTLGLSRGSLGLLVKLLEVLPFMLIGSYWSIGRSKDLMNEVKLTNTNLNPSTSSKIP